MPSALPVMAEVAGAAAALAGFILVFLGGIFTSFETYTKPERRSVAARFQRRAWFGFIGFALALVATFLALVAKWLTHEGSATGALVLLILTLIWVLFATLSDVREVR